MFRCIETSVADMSLYSLHHRGMKTKIRTNATRDKKRHRRRPIRACWYHELDIPHKPVTAVHSGQSRGHAAQL